MCGSSWPDAYGGVGSWPDAYSSVGTAWDEHISWLVKCHTLYSVLVSSQCGHLKRGKIENNTIYLHKSAKATTVQ